MKPHIVFRNGGWLCGLRAIHGKSELTIVGHGKNPKIAYDDWASNANIQILNNPHVYYGATQ